MSQRSSVVRILSSRPSSVSPRGCGTSGKINPSPLTSRMSHKLCSLPIGHGRGGTLDSTKDDSSSPLTSPRTTARTRSSSWSMPYVKDADFVLAICLYQHLYVGGGVNTDVTPREYRNRAKISAMPELHACSIWHPRPPLVSSLAPRGQSVDSKSTLLIRPISGPKMPPGLYIAMQSRTP